MEKTSAGKSTSSGRSPHTESSSIRTALNEASEAIVATAPTRQDHGGSDTPLPSRRGNEPVLIRRKGFEMAEVIGFMSEYALHA